MRAPPRPTQFRAPSGGGHVLASSSVRGKNAVDACSLTHASATQRAHEGAKPPPGRTRKKRPKVLLPRNERAATGRGQLAEPAASAVGAFANVPAIVTSTS